MNDWRQANGMSPYRWSDPLETLARGHSQDMAAGRLDFGHDGLPARLASVQTRMSVAAIAENIAHPAGATEAEVATRAVEQWTQSPVHRRNLSGPHELSAIGAARSEAGDYYLTQLFVKLR